MKYLFPMLFVSVFSSSLFSQSNIGKLFIGGQISMRGYSNNRIESFRGRMQEYEYNYFSLSVNPMAGRFINENIAIGLGVNYQFYYSGSRSLFNNSPSGNSFSYYYHTFSLTPYLIKFYPVLEKLYLTTSLGLSVGAGKSYSGGDTFNLITLGINFIPGVRYFMNDRWMLSLGIGNAHYDWTRETLSEGVSDEGKRIRHDYGIRLRLSNLSLGLHYFLD